MEDGYILLQPIYGLKHIKFEKKEYICKKKNMEQLTIEQALNNIRIILDQHKADKATHVVIDQSFELVKKSITL